MRSCLIFARIARAHYMSQQMYLTLALQAVSATLLSA